MNTSLIEEVRKLRIGYCVSCQNLFCKHPEIRNQKGGNCAEWSRP